MNLNRIRRKKFDKEKRWKVWSNRDKMTDFLIASLFYPKLIRFISNRSRIYEWQVPFSACWLSLRKSRKAECAGGSLKLLSARIKSVDRESKNWERSWNGLKARVKRRERTKSPNTEAIVQESKVERWHEREKRKSIRLSHSAFSFAPIVCFQPYSSRLSFLYLFLIFFFLPAIRPFIHPLHPSFASFHPPLCFSICFTYTLIPSSDSSFRKITVFAFFSWLLLFFCSTLLSLRLLFSPSFPFSVFQLAPSLIYFLRSLFLHPCTPFFYSEASRRRSDIVEVL